MRHAYWRTLNRHDRTYELTLDGLWVGETLNWVEAFIWVAIGLRPVSRDSRWYGDPRLPR